MNEARVILYNTIPHLDDSVFDKFAGVYNAIRLERPLSDVEELRILHNILQQEYNSTANREYLEIASSIKEKIRGQGKTFS